MKLVNVKLTQITVFYTGYDCGGDIINLWGLVAMLVLGTVSKLDIEFCGFSVLG